MKNSEVEIVDKVTVERFVEVGGKELGLEVVAGEEGMGNRITEAAINRSGLALTGFFEYFAFRRIQVIGLAEHTYLSSMGGEARETRLRPFFERKIPCVVVARGKGVFPELRRLGAEMGVPVLRTRMITKNFVNAATIIMENLMAPRMRVHGTMVEILGIGVLLEGKGGMGKSETALALVKRGHALVSDDVTSLRLTSSGEIVARPVEATRYHMEIRGLDIIHVPSLFGVGSVREEKRLDLIVTLCAPDAPEFREHTIGARKTRRVFGVAIPQVLVPVAPGRHLGDVVETAALNERLKRLGHDAVKEFDERLIALMNRGEGKAAVD